MADLGDRSDVQNVVESPVAASRRPVSDAAAGGELDRRRRGEPGWVAGEADEHAATIGPIPKISVNVVPDAATAVVIRRLESRI
jgi:hypothetical protein